MRLVGGENNRRGRLEICNAAAWGTVCDDLFSSVDANIVCRQLGFSDSGNRIVPSFIILCFNLSWKREWGWGGGGWGEDFFFNFE